ncbi:hypothetical protein Fcan01_15443 [Folsomia candida]|uniref:SAM domain-containing protein n=1 Tax=Folsomia candida TaxID=158441 RepID=A0A226DWI0_FOLCA|nr:hypothetical protein Fcan01_15443 [Folsomia candida]
MEELKRLLDFCGLNSYIDQFEANHINDDTLQQLTKEDLAIVIPSIGHRVKLWNAIQTVNSKSIYQKTPGIETSQSLSDEISEFDMSLISSREARDGGIRTHVRSLVVHKPQISTPKSGNYQFLKRQTLDFEGTNLNEEIALQQSDVPSTSTNNESPEPNSSIQPPESPVNAAINYVFVDENGVQIANNDDSVLPNQDETNAASNLNLPRLNQPKTGVIQPNVVCDIEAETPYYGFDLKDILYKDEAARSIINDKIPKDMFILRNDRQIVANLLVDAIIKNLGLRHLVSAFPSLGDGRKTDKGYAIWFFNSNHISGPTGFLEERLKNQRRRLTKLKRKLVPSTNSNDTALDWNSEFEDDNPDPDEKIMLYLRQNFPPNHNSEILEKMKETVFSRKTIIRRCIDKEDYTDLKQIPEIMPRLFDLQGMVKNNYSNVL